MFGGAKAAPSGPIDGRLGWFEGVREDRICGWTYEPTRPEEVLEVTLSARGGAALTLRADRLRAELPTAAESGGYHGFSAPLAMLPGAEEGATCVWSDGGLALPGSPWSPAERDGRRFRAGSMVLKFDSPPAGDPRLTGYVFDSREPFRRVRLCARALAGDVGEAVASLYRDDRGLPGDGFHGFVLRLPAPLRALGGRLEVIDVVQDRTLARLGPKTL
jgi:hypothetical protein